MTDLSDKVALVFDEGENIALARRLSREFGIVRYFSKWKEDYPKSKKLAIGTGYHDIERVRHFEDVINSTDLFIFPGIYHGTVQHDLEMRGKRVWGSRRAERLEYDRPYFLKVLEQCGLPVPEYKICHGVDELEEYLSDGEKRWVKLNLRGDGETWCSKTPEQTKRKIEEYRFDWGPICEDIVFTVVDHIDTDVEAAYDGFLVTSAQGNPQFSEIGFLGYEAKDQSHILRAIPYDEFPESVRVVNDKFGPVAAKFFMRSAFGTEIKVLVDEKTDEETSMFLDFTARQPNPPGPIIAEQVSNLGEFFWHGAVGENIPLEIEEEFGVQVNICSTRTSNFIPVEFPEEFDPWVKLMRCCYRDGVNQVICDADSKPGDLVGAVVALGRTIQDAIDKAKAVCEELTGDVACETDSLADVLKRITHGEEQGIEFADKIPEPAEVIE